MAFDRVLSPLGRPIPRPFGRDNDLHSTVDTIEAELEELRRALVEVNRQLDLGAVGGTPPTPAPTVINHYTTEVTTEALPSDFYVRDYGAVGDGVTNDLLSIQDALTAADAYGGGRVIFDAGLTYGLGDASLIFYKGLTLEGNGSTLKRLTIVVTGSRQILTANAGVATYATRPEPCVIRDITLNQNSIARGSTDPDEHCILTGAIAASPERFICHIENVTCEDSYGAGIHTYRNDDVKITRVRTHNCRLGGIVVTGGNSKVWIDQWLDTGDADPWGVTEVGYGGYDEEVDSPGFGGNLNAYVTMTNVQLQGGLDIIFADGHTDSRFLGSDIIMFGSNDENAVPFGFIGRGAGELLISNSTLIVGDDTTGSRIAKPGQATLDNCRLLLKYQTGWVGTTKYGLIVQFNFSGSVHEYQTVNLKNCTFTGDSSIDPTDTTYALYVPADDDAQLGNRIIVEGCHFDDATTHGIYVDQGGRIAIADCRFESRTVAMTLRGNATRPLDVDISNIRSVSPNYMEWNTDTSPLSVIRHNGVLLSETENAMTGGTGAANWTMKGSRTVLLDTAPIASTTITQGIVGDIAIYQPNVPGVADVVSIYRCTKTRGSTANAAWSFESSVGERTLDDTGTPSVAGAFYFVTSGTATITDFDDGLPNQHLYVRAAHSLTIQDGGGLVLAGDHVMTSGDTMHLYTANGTTWRELSRSNNA